VRVLIAVLGLIFAGLCAPALAFGDCNSVEYVAVFDARLRAAPAARCTELARFEIPHDGRVSKMRVLGVVGDRRDNEARWIAHVGALAGRLGGPMSEMGQLDLERVSILLTSLEEIEETEDGALHTHAVAYAPGPSECFVTFYKLDDVVALDEFVFTLAHELFHCIQQKTWGAHTIYLSHAWWVEGTAEYFANLVQRGTSFSDGHVEYFSSGSLNRNLFEMMYESVVFFFWMGQERGPSGVREFIEAMPETDSRSAQLAALRAAVPIDAWMDFGESYMDGDIEQPGGRAVPRPENAREIFSITGRGRVVLATAPYVVSRYGMSFAEGKVYKLATAGPDSVRVRMAERANMWSDPPARVLACDEDKTFRALVLTVDDPASTALNVDDPEELDQRACCLIGDWAPTSDSLDGFCRAQAEIGMGSASCSYVGGGWTLRFAPDGKAGISWSDYANRSVVSGGGGQMVQTNTLNGDLEFDWTVVDRSVGRQTYTKNTMVWSNVVEIGPQRIARSLPDSGPPVADSGFAYQCTEADLEIEGLWGLNQHQKVHRRAGPPP
jgi:hypothetical protein